MSNYVSDLPHNSFLNYSDEVFFIRYVLTEQIDAKKQKYKDK